jgi:hypothetical protein
MKKITEIIGKKNAVAFPEDDECRPVYDIRFDSSKYELLFEDEVTIKEIPEEVIESLKEMEEYGEIKFPAENDVIRVYETRAEDGTRIDWYVAETWETWEV